MLTANERDVVLSFRFSINDRAPIDFKDENEILGRAPDPHLAYVNEVLPIKLRYSVDYVAQRSFWSDVGIILMTVRALVRGVFAKLVLILLW